MNETKIVKELNKIIYAKNTLCELIEYTELVLIYYDNIKKRKKYIGEIYMILKKFNYRIKKMNTEFEQLISMMRSYIYQIYSGKKEENKSFIFDFKTTLEKLNKNVTTCKKSQFKKDIKKLNRYGEISL